MIPFLVRVHQCVYRAAPCIVIWIHSYMCSPFSMMVYVHFIQSSVSVFLKRCAVHRTTVHGDGSSDATCVTVSGREELKIWKKKPKQNKQEKQPWENAVQCGESGDMSVLGIESIDRAPISLSLRFFDFLWESLDRIRFLTVQGCITTCSITLVQPLHDTRDVRPHYRSTWWTCYWKWSHKWRRCDCAAYLLYKDNKSTIFGPFITEYIPFEYTNRNPSSTSARQSVNTTGAAAAVGCLSWNSRSGKKKQVLSVVIRVESQFFNMFKSTVWTHHVLLRSLNSHYSFINVLPKMHCLFSRLLRLYHMVWHTNEVRFTPQAFFP